jgi:hypothetical protein
MIHMQPHIHTHTHTYTYTYDRLHTWSTRGNTSLRNNCSFVVVGGYTAVTVHDDGLSLSGPVVGCGNDTRL